MQPRSSQSPEGTFCFSTGFLAVTQGNLFLLCAKCRNLGEILGEGAVLRVAEEEILLFLDNGYKSRLKINFLSCISSLV